MNEVFTVKIQNRFRCIRKPYLGWQFHWLGKKCATHTHTDTLVNRTNNQQEPNSLRTFWCGMRTLLTSMVNGMTSSDKTRSIESRPKCVFVRSVRFGLPFFSLPSIVLPIALLAQEMHFRLEF